MEFFVYFSEMRVGNVSVNLGCRDVGVTEKSLNGAEIGAVHKEVSRERMAKGVRGNVFCNAGGEGVFFYDALNGASSEASEISGVIDGVKISRVVEKESGERVAPDGKIFTDAVGGSFRDKDWTVFLALSTDEKFATIEVDRIAV